MQLKCTKCIEQYVEAVKQKGEETGAILTEEDFGPLWERVNDAVTIVPSWQSVVPAPGQMVLACVPLPTCMKHINYSKPSPEQIASRSGLLIPGMG